MFSRAFLVAVTSTALLVAPVSGDDAHAETWKNKKVVVRPGDTLSRIAARNDVSVDDLRRWNRRKVGKNDLIRLGDTLIVKVKVDDPPESKASEAKTEETEEGKEAPKWVGFYEVRSGDTLGGIARKLGVSTGDLARWNKMKRDSTIRIGQSLRYEKPGERPPARSIGTPTQGRLVNGVHLGKGRGYRLRFPKAAWALPYVNKILRRCARHVARRFPGTAKILIGDISKPTGGLFPPHASHQSGRDADVGYYLRGNKQNITLHRVGAYQLDYAKNWTMLRCYLRTGRVVRVYMDTEMQRGYAKYLRDKNLASDELLGRLFEVSSDDPKSALVKHSPGHDTHLHVRFACQEGNERCQEEEGDVPFVL